MKRALPLVLILMLAIALGLAAGPARANSTQSSLTVETNAQFISAFFVNVGVRVTCFGGAGTVNLTVYQAVPETTANAVGTGSEAVICDGRGHSYAVEVFGFPFDTGRAVAVAELVAPSGPEEVEKQINIGF